MGERFVIEERQSRDGYEYWWVLVGTTSGCEIGADRMEPEDARFTRDLSWVPAVLNQLDGERLDALRECSDLRDEVERLRAEVRDDGH